MMTLTSKLLTILLSIIPITKNKANPLNNSNSHYKKTKIPILTILFLLILYILIKTLCSI